jgi:hypothetical protein
MRRQKPREEAAEKERNEHFNIIWPVIPKERDEHFNIFHEFVHILRTESMSIALINICNIMFRTLYSVQLFVL